MKLQQLRQIIREEISEMEKSPSSINTGIISFEDLKQAVIKNASGLYTEDLETASTPDKLVNALGQLSINAYNFIFDSILTEKFYTDEDLYG